MKNRPTNPMLRAFDSVLEGNAGSWLITLFVIPLLVLFALVLPPLALPQRILSAGYSGISSTGGSVSAEGAQFAVPAGATKAGVSIKLSVQPLKSFLASSMAKQLPANVEVKSSLYQPSLQGALPAGAYLSVPIPDGADPFSTLDVYGYNGKQWAKLPFQPYIDEQRIETYLTNYVPQGVVVVQTLSQPPSISADLNSKTALPAAVGGLLTEVNLLGYTLAESGGIADTAPTLPEASASSNYQILPTVNNFDGSTYRGDLVDDLLGDAAARKVHIQGLVNLAVQNLYTGVNLDYQDVSPENQKAFSSFVKDVADALHAKSKLLSVTVSLPDQKAIDAWDTGAFDWNAIGQHADIVRIPMPNTRDVYAGGAQAPVHAYLTFATGRIDRAKLQLAFSVLGRDEFGNQYVPISFANAAKLIGQADLPATVVPGTKITLDLPRLRDGGVKTDAASGWFYFNYKDDKNVAHTIYLESADSIAKKLALATEYNLRGITLYDLSPDAIDARAWDAVQKYRDSQPLTVKSKPVIVWKVNGAVVGKSPGNDPRFAWTAPASGEAKVEAALSLDDGATSVSAGSSDTVQVAKLQPTAAPTSAAPKPAVPAAGPAAPAAPPSSFRGKNLFGYGIQVHGGDPGGEAADIKALGFNWVKVQMPWKDVESGKGNYNWTNFDNFVNTMSGNGIQVLLSIVKAPDWSRRQYGNPGEGPPDNMQDAADFMGAAAARYCGKVGAIEVWNEANLDVEWHDKRGLSAALYMDMLKKAYVAIKAKCPTVVVVAGASTPNGLNSATAIDDVTYLHQMYQNGLKDYSDAVGAHPSGFRSPPDIPAGNLGSYADHRSFFFRGTMDAYRAVMVQYGDSNKQIWATEFGWPVGTGGGAHPAGQYNSPEVAADYYVRAYQWAKAQGWVGVMFAWQLDFSGGEVGAFRIKGAPAFGRLQAMPK